MRKIHYLITCSLMIAIGWANALAQESPTVTPAQRLNLELINNVSHYNIDEQQNEYTNTFRLTQPTDNKLTAGMLKQGDNYITLHRYDDEANDIPFARINLSATTTTPKSEVIDMLDFYQDGEGAHSGSVTLTQADLGSESNWGTDGTNLIWQASGYAYITNTTGFTFTVPSGYNNATLQFIIYNGTNVRGGYWAYNLNDEGWSIGARASASSSSSFVITGLNSGDIISFLGAQYSNGYSLYQSPDIELIGVVNLPLSYIPSIEVTPSISYWDKSNEDWGAPSSLGRSMTYTPNYAIDLSFIGVMTDQFAVKTNDNEHSDYYNYKADLDANVIIPTNGETGLDFYASADFTACTTTNPSSGTLTGHNGWSFNGASAYMDDNNGIWAYIVFYGAIIFQMPETFLGNNVTVTVTSGPNLDNSDNNNTGILYVNDVLYTFTGSGTHSWTVPVSAGGIIEFKTDGQTYSTDIASIVISSGNGNAMSAPAQASNGEFTSLPRGLKVKTALPIEQSKKQREFKAIINDK
ncbi:MAG: hypothetical protein SPL96_01005 [Bacteroidales bacterium]|nr:hypothetical protein [Bacteroidales bacterium]